MYYSSLSIWVFGHGLRVAVVIIVVVAAAAAVLILLCMLFLVG